MTVTPAILRASFPEFASTTNYPDTAINFWVTLAVQLLDPARWGTVYDFGVQLFAAHNLALGYASVTAAGSGGQAPGAVMGALTSATVDKVGYSRDASAALDPKNGHWNLTTFGLRYIQLVRMMGAGPVYVGAGYDPGCTPWSGVNYPAAW